MKVATPTRSHRITDQHRTVRGFVYHLDLGGRRLRICIEEAEADGRWRAEARAAGPAGAELCAAAESTSRADALRIVAEDWLTTVGPPDFDWATVTSLLGEVRAL